MPSVCNNVTAKSAKIKLHDMNIHFLAIRPSSIQTFDFQHLIIMFVFFLSLQPNIGRT